VKRIPYLNIKLKLGEDPLVLPAELLGLLPPLQLRPLRLSFTTVPVKGGPIDQRLLPALADAHVKGGELTTAGRTLRVVVLSTAPPDSLFGAVEQGLETIRTTTAAAAATTAESGSLTAAGGESAAVRAAADSFVVADLLVNVLTVTGIVERCVDTD
jgi:hypothetical protein